MLKAIDALTKSAATTRKHTVERRLGKKPGDVKTRTTIGGRSYDHVNTDIRGERQLHPTNIHQPLGTITHTIAHTFLAKVKGQDLGEHQDCHKAAHAIVGHVRGIGGFGVFGLGPADADADGDADDPGANG